MADQGDGASRTRKTLLTISSLAVEDHRGVVVEVEVGVVEVLVVDVVVGVVSVVSSRVVVASRVVVCAAVVDVSVASPPLLSP